MLTRQQLTRLLNKVVVFFDVGKVSGMCDRGASYAVKQMVRCGIAVASDCAVHTMMKEKILWMKEKYTLVW